MSSACMEVERGGNESLYICCTSSDEHVAPGASQRFIVVVLPIRLQQCRCIFIAIPDDISTDLLCVLLA